ncbi:hypothetical protein D6C89_10825, partial [Aureobasidium pullulans]
LVLDIPCACTSIGHFQKHSYQLQEILLLHVQRKHRAHRTVNFSSHDQSHSQPHMSRNNPFPTREPFRPSQGEVNMLNYMTTQLSIKSPYRRYPPLGVPCPEGPMTYQLAIRREKWWEMLEDLAWKERLMMEKEEAKENIRMTEEVRQKEEVRNKGQKKETWTQEDHQKERKDSAGLIVVAEDVAAKANKSEPVCQDVDAASAIYESSEEEEVDGEQDIPEQSKEVKVKKKKGMVKEKDKPHKHEHKIRRV